MKMGQFEDAVTQLLKNGETISVKDLQEILGVTYQTAKAGLKLMTDVGKLECERNKLYKLPTKANAQIGQEDAQNGKE